MPVNKRIALCLSCTHLFGDDVAVIGKKPLLSSLCRRARAVVTAEPARVEEVLRAVPGLGEKLLGKRPCFSANFTLPPGQARFARIHLAPRALSRWRCLSHSLLRAAFFGQPSVFSGMMRTACTPFLFSAAQACEGNR